MRLLLQNRRNTRIKPSIDDKILLGWNALLLTAFCKAYASLNEERYRVEAIALFDFICSNYKNKDGGFYHTYKNGTATQPAFLDDYAYLIQACIFLQEITFDERYLLEAKAIATYVIGHFEDNETGMFYYTRQDQGDVLIRKTEIYDGAVPSGNSVMAENLIYLSVIFNNPTWSEKGNNMINRLKEVIGKYPTSFGVWAAIILKQTIGIHEIVITGNDINSTRAGILDIYLPNKVFQGGDAPRNFPLLMGKNYEEKTWIYLCKQYECGLPVSSIIELKKQLNKRIS